MHLTFFQHNWTSCREYGSATHSIALHSDSLNSPSSQLLCKELTVCIFYLNIQLNQSTAVQVWTNQPPQSVLRNLIFTRHCNTAGACLCESVVQSQSTVILASYDPRPTPLQKTDPVGVLSTESVPKLESIVKSKTYTYKKSTPQGKVATPK